MLFLPLIIIFFSSYFFPNLNCETSEDFKCESCPKGRVVFPPLGSRVFDSPEAFSSLSRTLFNDHFMFNSNAMSCPKAFFISSLAWRRRIPFQLSCHSFLLHFWLPVIITIDFNVYFDLLHVPLFSS